LGFKRIVGIDPQPANIRKAKFLKEHFHMTNVDFICVNAEQFSPSEDFDYAIMLGVINHVHDPVGILENIYSYTKKHLILDFDSQCPDYVDNSPEPQFSTPLAGVQGNMRCFFERSHQVTSASDSNLVFQYSKRAMLLMMNAAGFSDVMQVLPRVAMPSHYKNEKRVLLVGRRHPIQKFAQEEIMLDQNYEEFKSMLANANPELLEENYKGYNICSYLGWYYAVPCGEMEEFDIVQVLLNKNCACGADLARVRYLVDRRVEGGKRTWRQAAEGFPDDSDRDSAAIITGRDLILQSKLAEAKKLFENLLDRHRKPATPCTPLIYYELGRIAAKQGSNAEARKWWEECLLIDPEWRRAQLGLANLDREDRPVLSHMLFE
jgi:tetratricopeptide (TPR) repeat protein